MKKIISFLFIVILAFILSSCIKTNTEITIDKNLVVEKKTVQDFTKINDILRKKIEEAKQRAKTNTWVTFVDEWDKYILKTKTEYWVSTESIDKIKKPCENYKKEDLEKDKGALEFKSYTCKNIDKNKALLSFNWWNIKKYIQEENWKYILKLNNINWENKSKKQTLEERKKAADMYKAYWIEMDFVINFPWKIERTDAWTFENNKLKFNIYDLLESKSDDPEVVFIIDPNSETIKQNVTNIVKDNTNVNLKSKWLLYRDMILSKNKLEKSVKRKKYLEKLDKIVDKYSNNNKALKKLYSRLDKLDLENKKFNKIKDIIIYLKAKVWLEIYKNDAKIDDADIINFDNIK